MDLSHWDMVDQLTLKEAACLAVGVDPNLNTQTPEAGAKIALLVREMEKSFDLAVFSARAVLIGNRDPDETTDSVLMPGSLPSLLVSMEIRRCIRDRKDFEIENVYAKSVQTFCRGDLDNWFAEKAFHPIYCFVPKPNAIDAATTVSEKPLHVRTKNNYLRLIFALANEFIKDFNPKKAHEAAGKIINATGIEIDEKTLAAYVSEAYSLTSKERE